MATTTRTPTEVLETMKGKSAGNFQRPRTEEPPLRMPPQGMTAKPQRAGVRMRMGARTKRILSAEAGMNSSLRMNLAPSTMGWRRPCGPTRFGPTRS